MDVVITLVAPERLDPTLVARVVSAVRSDHAERLSVRATDVFCAGSLDELRAATATVVGSAPLDTVVQPVATRRKRLLVSDMDSTLIGQECIDELASVLGLKPKVAAITEAAMRGELDFAAALRERVALLKGTPERSIAALLRDTITLSPGALTMIATLKAHNVRTILVSGGFTAFAEPVARRLGMDAAFANRLIVADGVLTGEVAEPILGADAKQERLTAECDAIDGTNEEAIALGDGANDLAMIETAGLGLAYRAKSKVSERADALIRYTDLTTVLYAIGLHDGAFNSAPPNSSSVT